MCLFPVCVWAQDTFGIGSKRFTESYILGEIVAQTISAAGEARAVHWQGMGNTAILFAALKSGAIHAYPEYTGTIAFELLGLTGVPDLQALDAELARHGLAAGIPFGFDNTYALAITTRQAATLGVTTISDLVSHSGLKFGLSQEFLNRRDGWPALRKAYGLTAVPRGLDHGLAYEALAAGHIDVLDVYSTDAKIGRYRLKVLVDDRRFFPAYDALILYRREVPQRFPRSWEALKRLEGRISAGQMIAMNDAAELAAVPFSKVAADFLAAPQGTRRPVPPDSRRSFAAALSGDDFWPLTAQHFMLVFVALGLSTAIGVPLGIWAERRPAVRWWILGAVGVLQTVPALALLAFLIATLDRIGTLPAVIALFLYGLLPIVRNTEAGLAEVSPVLKESAAALGLPARVRLTLIEIPLAARTILAGVKTSAVINVGTATIAAFIGAGGYGERIVAGLAVNDHALLLAGAVPAACMALLIEGSFAAIDRWAIPRFPGRGRRAPG
ncbi:MAG: ABC transporter permease subunit [Betaproteobacteria bacterium]|nr:ABC transporter permease subunit [Betaproteobacteria bacterium]